MFMELRGVGFYLSTIECFSMMQQKSTGLKRLPIIVNANEVVDLLEFILKTYLTYLPIKLAQQII